MHGKTLAAAALLALLPLWSMFSLHITAVESDRPNRLTQKELDDGWILLFDGETLFGWKATSDANWRVKDGTIRVSEGAAGWLHTTSQFGDYALHVEFRHPPQTNSGVFLRTPPTPTSAAVDCYEVNIANESVNPFPTGSLVRRKKSDVTRDSDVWHAFDITAKGGHVEIKLDQRSVVDYSDPKPLGRGYIGLQYLQGPVEFRNIRLKPLGLEPIFNGRDLAGWRPIPDQKSEFSVTGQGELSITNGPGHLETEREFGDFVLQLQVFSNGKHLNSGIFFRNLPGKSWQGYESQIHNGFREGDRTQPMDFGTGGFYRRQKARRIVADDRQWFHMTLAVEGPHMATWVNGYQVSDWTDTRALMESARDGLRLKPGTIALQGHDPTTDLRFRRLMAGETAPR